VDVLSRMYGGITRRNTSIPSSLSLACLTPFFCETFLRRHRGWICRARSRWFQKAARQYIASRVIIFQSVHGLPFDSMDRRMPTKVLASARKCSQVLARLEIRSKKG
jgi:hypothetical protein